MEERKETPRSSTTSVDISARGIAGQEDVDSNNNNSDHGNQLNNKEDNVPSIRGGNKTVKMILLTQCLAGLQFTCRDSGAGIWNTIFTFFRITKVINVFSLACGAFIRPYNAAYSWITFR
ncbi:hypothetical protein RclHR1_17540002 [Rhizophagus clarus]|uniref:Uncharacterized protein n=1 Tax=Rhizophagus clarus TaxID=94130 RepID=A0A2Z6QXP0_9GLOM|nr:hypothetical protein RclHR1_17540002 [Rhizophagus clarus]